MQLLWLADYDFVIIVQCRHRVIVLIFCCMQSFLSAASGDGSSILANRACMFMLRCVSTISCFAFCFNLLRNVCIAQRQYYWRAEIKNLGWDPIWDQVGLGPASP